MFLDNLQYNTLFFICVPGVILCFICYGFLQENIFRGSYSQESKFKHPSLIVLSASLFSFCLAHIVDTKESKKSSEKRSRGKLTLRNMCILGGLNYGAMMLSNAALQYISFPSQVLAKSSKTVPVILISLLFGGLRIYTFHEYFLGGLITAGQLLYNWDKISGAEGENLFGMGLLLGSLLCDGGLAYVEDKVNQEKKISSFHLMKWMNLLTVIFVVSGIIIGGEVITTWNFLCGNPTLLYRLLLIGVVGSMGQAFIFITLTHFGALVVSVITTIRKFLSVFISMIYYQNVMKGTQLSGAICVAIAILFDLYSKIKSKRFKKVVGDDLKAQLPLTHPTSKIYIHKSSKKMQEGSDVRNKQSVKSE